MEFKSLPALKCRPSGKLEIQQDDMLGNSPSNFGRLDDQQSKFPPLSNHVIKDTQLPRKKKKKKKKKKEKQLTSDSGDKSAFIIQNINPNLSIQRFNLV